MQGTLRLLELVRDKQLVAGSLRGLFHIAIGRTVTYVEPPDARGGVLLS